MITLALLSPVMASAPSPAVTFSIEVSRATSRQVPELRSTVSRVRTSCPASESGEASIPASINNCLKVGSATIVRVACAICSMIPPRRPRPVRAVQGADHRQAAMGSNHNASPRALCRPRLPQVARSASALVSCSGFGSTEPAPLPRGRQCSKCSVCIRLLRRAQRCFLLADPGRCVWPGCIVELDKSGEIHAPRGWRAQPSQVSSLTGTRTHRGARSARLCQDRMAQSMT